MARDLIAMLAALAAFLMAAPVDALAQAGGSSLPDPTRPPASIGSQAAPGSAVRIPLLQSVFISRERKWAIIGGERIDLGGKFGDARLTGLTEGEATLEGPQGRTILRLVPEVQIKMTGAVPAAAEEPRTQSKSIRPGR